MKINVTASGNFDNKKAWSGVKKHMEHDPNLNHRNKFLNTDESKQLRKFNRHEILIDFDNFTKEKFQPYISEHDRNEQHKNKKYNSVTKFLEQKSRTSKNGKTYPVQLFVEKFGDMETFNEIKDITDNRLKTKAIKGKPLTAEQRKYYTNKIFSNGLKEYAKGFNQRNPNLKMFEYYVHMDEKGAPHLHAPVMPYVDMGKTSKGLIKQPSTSLNRALHEQYQSNPKLKTNQQRLSEFRRQEDTAVIDSINNQFERYFKEKPFELVRKTDSKQVETGINHDEYIAKQQAEERNRQLQISISNNEKILDKQEKTKKSNQDELDKQKIKLNAMKTSKRKLNESLSEQATKIKKYFSNITDAIVRKVKGMGFLDYDNLQENEKLVNDIKDVPDLLRQAADTIEGMVDEVQAYDEKMAEHIKDTSEVQKTGSKEISHATGKKTHATEKDDGLEY